jgi:hypothetical protein
MRKHNPNHPIFRGVDPEEDSCIAFARLVNERYVQRQQTAREQTQRLQPRSEAPRPYMATDDDLPTIFWSKTDENEKENRYDD